MGERDDEQLPVLLARGVELLRREPVVDTTWRDAIVRDLAPTPPALRRRVSLSVPAAIAAGLFCALVGGSAAILATRSTAPAFRIANAEQTSASGSTVLPVRFNLVAPAAATVSIVGDFNHWNPTTLPMKRSADGRTWEVEVRLPLGRYSYAFMVDGKLSPDPAAPRGADDDFGAPNSVLMVHGS